MIRLALAMVIGTLATGYLAGTLLIEYLRAVGF